jgi:hypothetical protein
MKRRGICAIALVLLALTSKQALAVVQVETIPIPHAGNAPDTRFLAGGNGAVAYEYLIGKYEITSGSSFNS